MSKEPNTRRYPLVGGPADGDQGPSMRIRRRPEGEQPPVDTFTYKRAGTDEGGTYRFVHAPGKVAEGFYLYVEPAAKPRTIGNEPPPIIIHGPPGCGKTTNRKWLAETFARSVDDVFDEWSPGDPVEAGKIYLTTAIAFTLDGLPALDHCVIVDFKRLGQCQPDNLPRYVPFTCGMGHVSAMATLALLERNLTPIGGIDSALVETIEELVSRAGVDYATGLLARLIGPLPDEDDDLPF